MVVLGEDAEGYGVDVGILLSVEMFRMRLSIVPTYLFTVTLYVLVQYCITSVCVLNPDGELLDYDQHGTRS